MGGTNGRRAGGQDQNVVVQRGASHRRDALCESIDFDDPVADQQFDPLLGVPVGIGQHQLFCVAMAEVLTQTDAVIRGSRLFAKRHDAVLFVTVEFDETFTKPMADHSIADDNNVLSTSIR